LLFCFLLKWLCFDVIRLMLEVKSERKWNENENEMRKKSERKEEDQVWRISRRFSLTFSSRSTRCSRAMNKWTLFYLFR